MRPAAQMLCPEWRLLAAKAQKAAVQDGGFRYQCSRLIGPHRLSDSCRSFMPRSHLVLPEFRIRASQLANPLPI